MLKIRSACVCAPPAAGKKKARHAHLQDEKFLRVAGHHYHAADGVEGDAKRDPCGPGVRPLAIYRVGEVPVRQQDARQGDYMEQEGAGFLPVRIGEY